MSTDISHLLSNIPVFFKQNIKNSGTYSFTMPKTFQ